MNLQLTKCHTLPGNLSLLLAWSLVFLIPVFFPSLFFFVLLSWLILLLLDRFLLSPLTKEKKQLKLILEIPKKVEYRSWFSLTVTWQPLDSKRPMEIVCFTGPSFIPQELHFPPGWHMRKLCARKKGRFVLDKWYLKVKSSFGFFTLWYPLPLQTTLFVENPLKRLVGKLQEKAKAAVPQPNKVGGQVEFHSLREYRMGDNLRHVYWKKSARYENEIFLKLFEQEQYQRVLFLLHTGMAVNYRWAGEDFLDYNIALLLAIAKNLLAMHNHVGLILYSNQVHQVIETASGVRQLQRLYDCLANVRSDGKTMPAPYMLSLLSRYIQLANQVILLQPLNTVAEAEHFLPVVNQWRKRCRIFWLACQRTGQLAISDPKLAEWQKQQQFRENALIRKTLTTANSWVIRASPQDCYREFWLVW